MESFHMEILFLFLVFFKPEREHIRIKISKIYKLKTW